MSSLPADVLVDLERTFRRLGVGWYVFGAQVAAIYGVARVTIDVVSHESRSRRTRQSQRRSCRSRRFGEWEAPSGGRTRDARPGI